jgi:HPr kinase/phosphorylase
MTPPTLWPPEALPATLHATAVSVAGRGVLIRGPAGCGKSSLALQLMALGAGLISDDLVTLIAHDAEVELARPPGVPDAVRIEARGIGPLRVAAAAPVLCNLIVDMGTVEADRLPPPRSVRLGEADIPTLRKVDNPAFPAMVLHYLMQPST